MRKIVVWNVMAPDGHFEEPENWDLTMVEHVWREEQKSDATHLSHAPGTMLVDRETYEDMAGRWSSQQGALANFFNGVEKIVVSDSLARTDWANASLLEGPPIEGVRALKSASGPDIFVFDSRDLVSALLIEGLVDEYRVSLPPVSEGRGALLFPRAAERMKMTLLGARALPSGGLILAYAPGK